MGAHNRGGAGSEARRATGVREKADDARYRHLTPYIAVIRGNPLPQNHEFLTLPPTRAAGSTQANAEMGGVDTRRCTSMQPAGRVGKLHLLSFGVKRGSAS